MKNIERDESSVREQSPAVNNPEQIEGFFNSEGLSLKYSIVTPDTLPASPHAAALILHGASTAAGRGRVLFEELQRKLADIGFASFAYDTRGVGESEGEFYDSTLANRLVDAGNAYDFFVGNPYIDEQRLAVLGLSMGGHVAARLVGAHPERYKSLILINAAAYGPQAEDKRLKPYTEFTDAIRQNFNWQNSLAFGDLLRFRGPVMAVDSELDEVIPQDVKGRYRLSTASLERHVVLPGIKHAFFSGTDDSAARAREQFYGEAASFLRKTL